MDTHCKIESRVICCPRRWNIARAKQEQILKWLENIDADRIDHIHQVERLQSSFQLMDQCWIGARCFGEENSNDSSYGWMNLAKDQKIKKSIHDSFRPQLSEKIIRKMIARGEAPTVLSIRFSMLVPAAYWVWFRFAQSDGISAAGHANSEQEEVWLQEVLAVLEDWYFLDETQLQQLIPAEHSSLSGTTVTDVLFHCRKHIFFDSFERRK